MELKSQEWTIKHLHEHLQYAVDLEFWTIPFYMAAMYSIIDRTSDAFQLIQSVLNQEMLHVQLASNIANAYGLSPTFKPPEYKGEKIPHLNFKLDTPELVKEFSPYSAEIGPLDKKRINAMCLIEHPKWGSQRLNRNKSVTLYEHPTEYGSIGQLYDALEYGARLLKSHLHGSIKQVDLFSAFYQNLPAMTVSNSGEEGFAQAALLINTIRIQGEGTNREDDQIILPFQNTADDSEPELSHYEKFLKIRDGAAKPLFYKIKSECEYKDEDRKLRENLVKYFTEFRSALKELFAGNNPDNFVQLMFTVGAAIHNCWKNGVTPRFS